MGRWQSQDTRPEIGREAEVIICQPNYHCGMVRHRSLTIVRYLGNSIEESDPKGIMFAATFVPRMLTDQPPAAKNTPVRAPAVQNLSRMASKRSLCG